MTSYSWMRNNENIRDYFGHLNKTMNIIYDAYASYTSKPEEPTPDNNNRLSVEEMRKFNKDGDRNLGQFVVLNLFWAGLLTELCRMINLHNMDKLKLNTAVVLAMNEARIKEETRTNKVYAMAQDDQPQAEEQPQVDAF